MDDQAGRLGHHQQPVVLVADGQRAVLGHRLPGRHRAAEVVPLREVDAQAQHDLYFAPGSPYLAPGQAESLAAFPLRNPGK